MQDFSSFMQQKLAEGEGFEPRKAHTFNGFQDRRDQPLCHPSAEVQSPRACSGGQGRIHAGRKCRRRDYPACKAIAPPKKLCRYATYLMASFRPLPGVNLATLLAGMVISLPVRGLRPLRAARSTTLKLPKPVKVTDSPEAKGFTQRGHHGVKSFFGFGFGGQAGFGMDFFYELSFGHDATP